MKSKHLLTILGILMSFTTTAQVDTIQAYIHVPAGKPKVKVATYTFPRKKILLHKRLPKKGTPNFSIVDTLNFSNLWVYQKYKFFFGGTWSSVVIPKRDNPILYIRYHSTRKRKYAYTAEWIAEQPLYR